MSKAGLFGLGLELKARTAYEPADPVGVDIEKDDLSFYPLLYWPMAASRKICRRPRWRRSTSSCAAGGTILFDTRDSPIGGLGKHGFSRRSGAAPAALQTRHSAA